MGTVERGESNLSFSNILKIASTLGVSLAVLFEGVDQTAEIGGRGAARKEHDPPMATRNSGPQVLHRTPGTRPGTSPLDESSPAGAATRGSTAR